MKATVVYHSLYGNTRSVADAIASTLREAGDVHTVAMKDLSSADLQDADLVIIGAPTHNMNAPEDVRAVLAALPRRTLAGTACAAFDTSYEMSRWLQPFTAARRLDKRMRRLGGKRIAAPESFLIERHHEGPLQEGELERARTWTEDLLERLNVTHPSN